MSNNGTMLLGRPLAPGSTNIAFDFTIADNGALTTRANGTILQCGFGDNGGYFECDTTANARSREGGDSDELLSEFGIDAEGRLSWRENGFHVCSALDSGWASNELPAWNIILADDSDDESRQDSSEKSCREIEVTAGSCRGWIFRQGIGEGDDNDSSDDPDANTAGSVSGSSSESGAPGLQSLWTVNIAFAVLWLLL